MSQQPNPQADHDYQDTCTAISELLDPRHFTRRSGGSLLLSVHEVATRMAEAGWRPPAHEVSTVADLEAVPEGALILRAGSIFGYARTHNDWDTGETRWTSSDPFRYRNDLATAEVAAELDLTGSPAYVVDISTWNPRTHAHSPRSDS